MLKSIYTYHCAQIPKQWRKAAQVLMTQAATSICTPNVISKVTPMPVPS